ncbi:MAG: hypothetical protein J6C28_01430 [Bacilli bacterium]|nr:hypothetical protein [Bacilli bacterium]
MYPKLNKKNRVIELLKNLEVEVNSLAVSIKHFLKGKDFLLVFMKKCFHI